MLLCKGWLTILCPILILFIILSFHSTITSGDKHHLDDNEVPQDDAETGDESIEGKGELVNTNDPDDVEGESRAGHPHRIRRIIRRRKKPKYGGGHYGAPQKIPLANSTPSATTSTTTTTVKPPKPSDKQREVRKLSTTTRVPSRLTTRTTSSSAPITTAVPIETTTSGSPKTIAPASATSTRPPVVTTKTPLKTKTTTTTTTTSASTATTTTTTTTTTKEPRLNKTSVTPLTTAQKSFTLKPASTIAPQKQPSNFTSSLRPPESTKKPLEAKNDAEQTVVKKTTDQGRIELVQVEKAPIKRPHEIKSNATVTANMPILSKNSTTAILKPNEGSGGQQVPIYAPSRPADASKVTSEQINKALDIPGVKCGQVPLYEKLYGRSINETVESAGKVRILHGLDSVAGEWPWIARITECKGSKCGTCTGTLLNHRWLITAGHCGYAKKDLSKFKVTFGLYDLVTPDESSFTLAIDKMIVHPDYKDLSNDLTLMRLAQPVKFGPNIQPACLLGPTRNLLGKVARKPAYNVGYGMTEGMSEALKLQKLRVKAKPPSECNSDTLGSVRLKPYTVCMGVPDGKIGGSCKGDSGGPNLYYEPASNQWVLFATVSYGPTVCDREDGEQWLTVSVDLSNYRSWILKTILLEG